MTIFLGPPPAGFAGVGAGVSITPAPALPVFVQNVTGHSQADAEKVASDMNLVPSIQLVTGDPRIGLVVGQSPPADSTASAHSRLTLFVAAEAPLTPSSIGEALEALTGVVVGARTDVENVQTSVDAATKIVTVAAGKVDDVATIVVAVKGDTEAIRKAVDVAQAEVGHVRREVGHAISEIENIQKTLKDKPKAAS